MVKLIKICQNQKTDFLGSFFTQDSLKIKRTATSFQVTSFAVFNNKHFSFVMLHKLAKFHYQTVFTS